MFTINNITAGYNMYGLSKNQTQSQSKIYSNQNNTITDTFSKGMTEKDIRYSFTFVKTDPKPKIDIPNETKETKSSLEILEELNKPRYQENIHTKPQEIYNLIGADIDNIQNNSNKVRTGITYHNFQNMRKDIAKEYKMLLYYYNSQLIDTLA